MQFKLDEVSIGHFLFRHFAFILQAGMIYYPKGTFGHVYKRLELKKIFSLSDDILAQCVDF